MRFALRCGVGSSMKAVHDTIGRFGRLLIDAAPDEVIVDIENLRGDAAALLDGFHVYPLGGLHKTNDWIQSVLGRAS